MPVNAPRHSEVLRQKIQRLGGRLNQAATTLWQHARLAEIYPSYLLASYSVVRASVPLMEAAHKRAIGMADRDSLGAPLAEYLAKHIPEEKGHDDWLLDDLAVMGVERDEALRKIPSPVVAALVGSQYYWILHFHPLAVLGYIAVLEGDPPRPEAVREVIDRTGIPERAFSTLLMHAGIDPLHRSNLDVVLDDLRLGPEHSALLGVSAIQTMGMLARVLDEVVETYERNTRIGVRASA